MAAHELPVVDDHIGGYVETPDRRWLLTGNLPCLGCQYNMRGLVGPIVLCPECGHRNDLRQPEKWQSRQLPLGVCKRSHWPATAVLMSLCSLPFAPLVIGYLKHGNFWPAVLLILAVAAWLWNCYRFVRSCSSAVWAIGILLTLHLASWSYLAEMGGLIAIFLSFEGVSSSFPLLLLFPLPLAAGIAGFWGVGRALKSGEDTREFRQDWRRWRLPIAEVEATERRRGCDTTIAPSNKDSGLTHRC